MRFIPIFAIMSKITAYFHIVFGTKKRKRTIPKEHREDLYRFIWSVISGLDCELVRIGGVSDHIHMLVNLNSSISLSELVRRIKAGSSGWMSSDSRFSLFEGWAAGYFASSVSPEHKEAVINYIRNQEEHHRFHTIEEELKSFCDWMGISFDERDLG